nr:MAG TPA: hypothetical protein [Caudoviricetes sp.]
MLLKFNLIVYLYTALEFALIAPPLIAAGLYIYLLSLLQLLLYYIYKYSQYISAKNIANM